MTGRCASPHLDDRERELLRRLFGSIDASVDDLVEPIEAYLRCYAPMQRLNQQIAEQTPNIALSSDAFPEVDQKAKDRGARKTLDEVERIRADLARAVLALEQFLQRLAAAPRAVVTYLDRAWHCPPHEATRSVVNEFGPQLHSLEQRLAGVLAREPSRPADCGGRPRRDAALAWLVEQLIRHYLDKVGPPPVDDTRWTRGLDLLVEIAARSLQRAGASIPGMGKDGSGSGGRLRRDYIRPIARVVIAGS